MLAKVLAIASVLTGLLPGGCTSIGFATASNVIQEVVADGATEEGLGKVRLFSRKFTN